MSNQYRNKKIKNSPSAEGGFRDPGQYVRRVASQGNQFQQYQNNQGYGNEGLQQRNSANNAQKGAQEVIRHDQQNTQQTNFQGASSAPFYPSGKKPSTQNVVQTPEQQQQQDAPRPLNEVVHVDLARFKTQECKNQINHNPKQCFFFHDSKKDRRRPLGTYSSDICQFANNHQYCPMSEYCTKSINRVEEFYHPEKYKVKFCASYPDRTSQCDYGQSCAFAHNDTEIAVDLIDRMERDVDFYLFYFKTVWCPYPEGNHQREICVFSHNWQDFRRRPNVFQYEPVQCQSWDTKTFVSTYADGCKHEYRCNFSHGWKEQEYHPSVYKVFPCRNMGTCQKIHCPYFHSDVDKRPQLGGHFKVFPRNRGTAQSICNMYSQLFMDQMLKDPSRILVNQFDKQSGILLYQQGQNVYGVGPNSVPIICPTYVSAFQQAQIQKQQFQPQQNMMMTPQTQGLSNQGGFYQSHAMAGSAPSFFPQMTQSYMGIQNQPQYDQLNQNLHRVPSQLSGSSQDMYQRAQTQSTTAVNHSNSFTNAPSASFTSGFPSQSFIPSPPKSSSRENVNLPIQAQRKNQNSPEYENLLHIWNQPIQQLPAQTPALPSSHIRKISDDDFQLGCLEEDDSSEPDDDDDFYRIKEIAKSRKEGCKEVVEFLRENKLEELEIAMSALHTSELSQLKELTDDQITNFFQGAEVGEKFLKALHELKSK